MSCHLHNRLQVSTGRYHLRLEYHDNVAKRSQLMPTQLIDSIPARSLLAFTIGFTQQWQRRFHLDVIVEPCEPAVHGLFRQRGGHVVCPDVVEEVLREDDQLVRVNVVDVGAGQSWDRMRFIFYNIELER